MALFPNWSLQDKLSKIFRTSPVEGPTIPSVGVVIENDTPIPVDIQDATIDVTIASTIKTSGTVDGLTGGTERIFINNRKSQVLAAHDLVATYTWLGFGTRTQRVDSIVYTSLTFPGVIVTRDFDYTQVGNKYRLDTETWSVNLGG